MNLTPSPVNRTSESSCRIGKILAQAKKQAKFSMQDVVAWLPDVPRRTLERDVAALLKKRALKAKGELKARIYTLAKWQR